MTPVSPRPRPPLTLPEGLLYAVILALPFEQLFTIGGGAITKWIGLSFFVSSLFERRTFYPSVPFAFWFYLIYAAIGVGGDMMRMYFSLSGLNDIIQPVLNGVFMIAAYNLAVRRGIQRLVVMLSVSAVLFALFQFFNLAADATVNAALVVSGEALDRASALGTDPNFSACFMALAVIPGVLAASGALPMRRVYRYFAYFASFVAAGGILMTGSRGGLLALVLGVLSILFVARGNRVRLKLVFMAVIVLTLLGYELAQDPLYRSRLEASIETRDTAHREEIWLDALTLSLNSPLVGFGYRSCIYELGAFRGEYWKGTHNLHLSVLLGTGLLGLSAFLIFYLSAARVVWRRRSSGLGVLVFPWFVTAFVGSLSLNLESSKWYWLITALSLAVGKACRSPLLSMPVVSPVAKSGSPAGLFPGVRPLMARGTHR